MLNRINKKERRQKRHDRNIKNELDHKKLAWESGKLIEENHNGSPYSSEYTINLKNRLIEYLDQEFKCSINSENPPESFLRGFRKYRIKIRDLIILWNPSVSEDNDFQFLKGLLETYWDKVLKNNDIESLFNYSLNIRYDK